MDYEAWDGPKKGSRMIYEVWAWTDRKCWRFYNGSSYPKAVWFMKTLSASGFMGVFALEFAHGRGAGRMVMRWRREKEVA